MRSPLALALLLAAGLWTPTSAEPLGDLTVVGVASTNDVALPSGSSVFPGDRLRTARESLAILASPPLGRLELRGGSSATVLDDSLDLLDGAAASSRLPIRGADFEAAPESPQSDAWFVVAERDREKFIAAHRGNVVVRPAGAAPFVVPAGSYALAAALPAPQQPERSTRTRQDSQTQDNGKQRRRKTGRAAGAGSNTGWSIGSLGQLPTIALVTGAGALAAVGLAARGGGALREEAVSPAN